MNTKIITFVSNNLFNMYYFHSDVIAIWTVGFFKTLFSKGKRACVKFKWVCNIDPLHLKKSKTR